MRFHYTDLDTCHTAEGLVIAIDVIRAFTTAACVLSRGADSIIPVGSIEEALAIREQNPGWLVCGEMKGIPPAGFNFGNSPTQVLDLDLRGRTVVQRTSAGTQGIVRSTRAAALLAASFVVASATVRYVQSLAPESVTFVATGQVYDGGAEDIACAEYLEACLRGPAPDASPYLERVRSSHDARVFFDPARPEFPETDIMYCTDLDRFNFAMPVERRDGLHVMRSVRP
jgi:2-phosphosulfolactate phosphatase